MAERPKSLSRRGVCLCCVGFGAFAAAGDWLGPKDVFAKAQGIVDLSREDAAHAEIKVRRLRGNIFVLEGSGGNIGVLNGRDGKLLVDAGITASKNRILEALASMGAETITQLINTHWHFDHSDGNAWLNGLGARITAHENTRKHLLATQRVEDWDFDFPQSPPAAIPIEVFSQEKTLKLNGASVHLEHYGPAHTDSDIAVHFVEADVLHVGDTYWNGVYPFIDYSTGGSIDGTICAAALNAKKATDTTIVVPGHGNPVSDRRGLIEFHDMLATIRDRIGKLKIQGLTLAETVAAKPTENFDAKWGQYVIKPAMFTKLVYEGV